jgi:hypothetical protein
MYYNEEIWKPVYLEEYKHLYEISNKGRVRRGNYIRKEVLDSTKYKSVILYNGKRYKNVRIHRLVFFSFNSTENPEQYQIHHRDGKRDNNHLYNLQKLTTKEHIELERKRGNNKTGLCGKMNTNFKGMNGQFDKKGYLLNFYDGSSDLKTNGFQPKSVCAVINKTRRYHRGFIWKRFPKEETPIVGKQYDMADPMWDQTIKKKKSEKMVQTAFKF